ncbi:Uncharacterised protein [Mycobacteroides abscessus subsp. abscessus]|nr:Uncharacterised protein [Mycobacteroides abscessus subsp. abscessus]
MVTAITSHSTGSWVWSRRNSRVRKYGKKAANPSAPPRGPNRRTHTDRPATATNTATAARRYGSSSAASVAKSKARMS